MVPPSSVSSAAETSLKREREREREKTKEKKEGKEKEKREEEKSKKRKRNRERTRGRDGERREGCLESTPQSYPKRIFEKDATPSRVATPPNQTSTAVWTMRLSLTGARSKGRGPVLHPRSRWKRGPRRRHA